MKKTYMLERSDGSIASLCVNDRVYGPGQITQACFHLLMEIKSTLDQINKPTILVEPLKPQE